MVSDLTLDAKQALQGEIEALLNGGLETPAVYRAVARSLFYRYKIVPNPNQLHALVSRGTKTAPNIPLDQFWEEVREKSQFRVEHADVPSDLLRLAGEMVAGLWKIASEAAARAYAEAEAEARDTAARADQARREAEGRAAQLAHQVQTLESSLRSAQAEVTRLGNELSGAKAANVALTNHSVQAREVAASAQQRAIEASERASTECQRLIDAMEKAETAHKEALRQARENEARERDVREKAQVQMLALQSQVQQLSVELAATREREKQLASNRVEDGDHIAQLHADVTGLREQCSAREQELLMTRATLAQVETRARTMERMLAEEPRPRAGLRKVRPKRT